jgi:hypothetical protein
MGRKLPVYIFLLSFENNNMNITNYGLLGIIFVIILILVAIGAIWLTCVILNESEKVQQSVKDVKCAYGNIEIEINKRLLNAPALHISDLIAIINRVGDMVPGVNIRLDREIDKGRHHIVIESGDVTSKLTFMNTIIEYRLSHTA